MAQITAAKPIPLDGTYNFRDLGGYPAEGGSIRRGYYFRSDALDRLSERDRSWMRQQGICCVIDLRGIGEAEKKPDILNSEIEYYQVPMTDRVTEEGGRRIYPERISDLYEEMLLRQGRKFAQVIHILAKQETGPVIFHCAVGKDRTGLTAMFLLALAGVANEVIQIDYAPSGENIRPLFEQAKQEAARTGASVLPEQMFLSPPEAMDRTMKYLQSQWGGPVAYLLRNGVTREEILALRQKLVS